MFGVKFSSSTSSSNWPPEPAASTVSPPNSCDPSNANRKLQHYPFKTFQKLSGVCPAFQIHSSRQRRDQHFPLASLFRGFSGVHSTHNLSSATFPSDIIGPPSEIDI